MTLQQIKYYIAVVNAGSINKAAETLFISQPSLSSAIRELESELDLELLIRTPRGIRLTEEGAEFLGYARQIAEQMGLLESRYSGHPPARKLFSLSTQHYAFAVNAFVNLIKEFGQQEYEFTLRETRTYEIMEDVANQRSELGILYTNDFNRKVIYKVLHENRLEFHPLFTAKPHIFVSTTNPLAQKSSVTLEDLAPYPCLSFEQGTYNSFYFSEEILSTTIREKNIRVSDRATIFNLMVGLNGYTISTGIVSADLNGDHIQAIPLQVEDQITVGWVCSALTSPGKLGQAYLQHLKQVIRDYGIEI